MSDAVRLGHPALFQAIESALDGINERVTADFRKQDDEWRQKYDKLRDDSRETQKRMEFEIGQLRGQVASLTSSLQRSEAVRLTGAAEAPASRDVEKIGTNTAADSDLSQGDDGSDENLSELVEELQKSLEKSQMRHGATQVQLDAAVALVRKRKAETLKWVEYADSLELKIKKLEKKKAAARQATEPPQGRTSTPTPTPAPVPAPAPPSSNLSTPALLSMLEKPQPQAEVSKPSLSASFSSSAASSFLGNPKADDEGVEPELPPQKIPKVNGTGRVNNEAVLDSTQGDPSSDASQPDLPTPRATNSDDVAGRVTIKNEPSSDGPEFVWERVTKKPKRDEQTGEGDRKTNPQTPRFAPAVKRESSDNTPRVLGLVHYRESQESIDLDEGQLTVQTPRKRHLFYEQQLLGERESDESSDSASQEKPAGEPLSKLAMAAPLPPRLLPPPPPPTPCTPSTPLAPISGNVRRCVKDPTKALKYLKRGIESLAEDNQAYSSSSGVSKRTAMEPPSTTKSSRLSSLLNSRPSEPSPVSSLPRPTPSATPRYHGRTDSPVIGLFGRPPPTRILPHLRDDDNFSLPRTPSVTATRSAATPTAAVLTTPTANPLTAALLAAKAESAAKKASSPLRGRPVDRLKMDDFKINPAFNNGETFAYNEVVRSRADRAGLAGCTDPQCCGKAFRGMATSELDATGPAHIRRSESIVLMERHLGDGAYMLGQMSPEEKTELWIEARTKELADKYGKHRHRYHRRASPPGFWDTDFPTTQDEERNRAEAEKVERITVQERYREAMRSGGGRWLFRDE